MTSLKWSVRLGALLTTRHLQTDTLRALGEEVWMKQS